MRNKKAKQLRKQVYQLSNYDAETSYKVVRLTARFKKMYRRRKKNYTRGILVQ